MIRNRIKRLDNEEKKLMKDITKTEKKCEDIYK